MLVLPFVKRIPRFFNLSHLPQVVYVPMRAPDGSKMMREPRPHAAGPEGAPHVAVVARLQVEPAQLADLDARLARDAKDQHVGA